MIPVRGKTYVAQHPDVCFIFFINFCNKSFTSTTYYKAIGKLDKLEKAIIILYLEEKSYEEIAEIAGITTTQAGVKISRI